MKAITVPARERILQHHEPGRTTAEIAAFCGFGAAAVRRVRRQFRQRGSLQPQTHRCGRKTLLTAKRQARLRRLVDEPPEATLAELGAPLDRRFGTSTVDGWLRRLGPSRKKTLPAAEQQRPAMAAPRNRWHERLAAVPSRRLVLVDESGVNTRLTRLHGRAPVGQRLVARAPQGYHQTTTLIAGMRLGGACAPWVLEGAMDGELFLAWVRQGLAPPLQPDAVVILAGC